MGKVYKWTEFCPEGKNALHRKTLLLCQNCNKGFLTGVFVVENLTVFFIYLIRPHFKVQLHWLARESDPDSSNIDNYQLTIDSNSNSSQFLKNHFYLNFALHHHNLNSLPPRPIKLKGGVNFQNMLPTSSNSSFLLQLLFSQTSAFPVYSEFDKFRTRSFCSQTNVITASQPG